MIAQSVQMMIEPRSPAVPLRRMTSTTPAAIATAANAASHIT